MTLPKHAARRDENEGPIVEALRAAGWGVVQLNGAGIPDLLCGRGKRLVLIEVIGDAKLKKYRKTRGRTPAQVKLHREWPGEIHLVRSVEEALAVVREAR